MPSILFDVLVPAEDAQTLEDDFANVLNKLVAAKKLATAHVTRTPNPSVGETVETELRKVYAGPEHDLEMHRYAIQVEGATGSINQLAMLLSRLMTPQADLPKDKVLLEREDVYELPPRYPWTVDIAMR